MRVMHDDEIRFTSMDTMDMDTNECSKLKGECTAVTRRCIPSVGPRLNPQSLSFKKILVTLSL